MFVTGLGCFIYCEKTESSLDLLESKERSLSGRFLVNFLAFSSSKRGAFLAVFYANKINF